MADYGDLDDLANLGAAADVIADVPDAQKLATIAARSRFADGFLRAGSITVPEGGLVAFTGDLTWAVMQLAVYDLVTNKFRYQTDGPNEDSIRKRYDDAIEWLKWVADGTVAAPIPATDGVELSELGPALVTSNVIRGWTSRGL